MLNKILEDIKATVLRDNPYLNKGYSYAVANKTGVFEGEKVLFPNDTLGDYFYIRPINLGLSNTATNLLDDCVSPVGIQATGVLVASLHKGDADELTYNIISTLAAIVGITPTAFSYNIDDVIQQELGKMDKSVLDGVKANVKPNTAIISVSFRIDKVLPLAKPNCFKNPCLCG